MELNIIVSQDNIKRSRKNSDIQNPIALAIKDEGFEQVIVRRRRAVIKREGEVLEARLSGSLVEFQGRYLAGHKLQPTHGSLHFFPLEQIQKQIFQHVEEK